MLGKTTCNVRTIKVAVLIVILCHAKVAWAQDGVWSIKVATPEAYSDSGSNTRRVFNRRFTGTGERNRIEISFQKFATESVEDFLLAQRQSKESLVQDSKRTVTQGSRQGLSFEFVGSSDFRGKTFNTRRQVRGFLLKSGNFLRITSQLVFPDKAPSSALEATEKTALGHLIENLELQHSAIRDTGATTQEPKNPVPNGAGETKPFRDDTTLPFAFDLPISWYVRTERDQAPGSLWVLATPFAEEAVYAPLESLEAALRVNVIGFLPELIGVKDGLSLAAKVVGQRFANKDLFTVNSEESGLLGSAKGRLVRYQSRKEGGSAGHILVVAVDASLLVAEFSWPAAKNSKYEQRSLAILNSFRIELDRSLEVVEKDGITFEYPGSNWTLTEKGTDDRSVAWRLQAQDTSLFLRSMPLADGVVVDNKVLKKTCELLVSGELGLTSQEIISDSTRFEIPGAESTWRCFFFDQNQAIDAFAMIRDGAFHLAIMTNSKGIRSFTEAQALGIFLSLKGNKPRVEKSLMAGKLFRRSCHFTSIQTEAFAANGAFIGHELRTLDFDEFGKVKSRHSNDLGSSTGTYALEGRTIVLSLGDKPPQRLEPLSTPMRFQANDGRIWHLLSNL